MLFFTIWQFCEFFFTFLRLILCPYEECNRLLSNHRVLMLNAGFKIMDRKIQFNNR